MASASGIRMGGVFVEIGADPKKFFSVLNQVNKGIAKMGKSLVSGGTRLTAAGVGMAAPIVAAVRQGARFESTLLNIRASTGATAAEIGKIKDAAMGMSQALGVGPTAAAQGMLELLKAGMSLESVLGGAGQSALEFAKVGEMDVAQAAVVMSDAMNVFGVSGDKAANTLSAAADASSTSISQIVEAFSNVGATGADANQTIDELSAAIAILGNNMVKGGDAGTALKSMMLRLTSGADGAAEGLEQVGLTTESFRDAAGNFLPLSQAMDVLRGRLDGLNDGDRSKVLYKIFGSYGLKAATILINEGSDGFDRMRDAMGKASPVGEKFKMMMSGLSGSGSKILSSLERLAIAISDAVAPAIAALVPFVTGLIDGFAKFVGQNREAVVLFAKVAVAAIGVGGAMVGLGTALKVASFAMGSIGKSVMVALSPLSALANVVLFTGKSFTSAVPGVLKIASAAGVGVVGGMNAAGNAMIRAASSLASLTALAGGQAAAGFASLAASSVRFAASAISSATAAFPVFFTGFNRAMAAGDGFFTATYRGFRGMAMASAGFRTAFAAIANSGFARFTGDIVYGLQLTYKTFTWWASGVAMRMSAYVGATATAAAASVANAVRSGTAWVASALPGVMAFVTSAIGGITAYLGAAAMAVVGSVASAAAVAAAWLAPLAPFALMAAAIAGVGALLYSFRDTIGSAFAGVSDMVGQAAGAIGSGFNTAVSDGMVVLGDLYGTAVTTFDGVYEAIAAGDLAGAMDILWAGLIAGWLRGVEAIMSYVDPWVAAFQDVFTDIGTGVYVAWDLLYTDTQAVLNTMKAWILGLFDNIANGVMDTFDNLVASIQIAWARVQGFITGAKDTEERVQAIKDENEARAEQRRQERPGIEGRTAKAKEENAKAEADREDRKAAAYAQGEEDKAARQKANADRAAKRREDTQAAEAGLSQKTKDKREQRRGDREQRTMNDQFDRLFKDIQSATTLDQLRDMYGEYDALNSSGRLTSGQSATLEVAIEDAQERITRSMTSSKSPSGIEAAAGANAAGKQSQVSMGSIAGTFSSLNLGAAFGGQTAADRTAKACEEIAKNTRDMKGDRVAA